MSTTEPGIGSLFIVTAFQFCVYVLVIVLKEQNVMSKIKEHMRCCKRRKVDVERTNTVNNSTI